MIIKHLRDRNGNFINAYRADSGRHYRLEEMYDESGNKKFDFTLIDMSDDEVRDAKSQAILVEAEEQMRKIRLKRDRLLSETDYWALNDTVEMTDEQRQYRQSLRDITQTYNTFNDVVWPEKP